MDKNITVILPLHMFDDTIDGLLKKSVSSVPKDISLFIACANGIKDNIKECLEKYDLMRDNITICENVKRADKEEGENEPHTFAYLVNKAVNNIKTEWFTILEVDDFFYDKVWDNFELYSKEMTDVNMFVPFNNLFSYERFTEGKQSLIGFINEAPWAASFSNEIGYIDLESLKNYFDYNLTGSFIKRDTFIKVGMLKKNIEVSFWNEFLLRFSNMGEKIYVIPKIGYAHYIGRENSLSDKYSKEMTLEEVKQWMNVAKEEYQYRKDRKIRLDINK